MARIPFIDTTHIEDLISEKKPELAGHTIKSYLSCYRCFCRTENKNLDNYPEWLKDTKSILRYCKKYASLGSQKTKMTAFVVLAKITNQPQDVIENLQQEMKKMIEEYQKNVELQQFTEKEHQNWLTYDELQELITETLKDMDKNGFYYNIQAREYFKTFRGQLLFLLTCFHPIRNEYGNLKITTDYSEENDDGEHNYLFIKGDKRKKYFIILNNYKTAKKYGRLRIRITEKRVMKPLKYYIDKYAGDYLFMDLVRKKSIDNHGITKALNSYTLEKTGRKLSTGMIRKILITHEMRDEDTLLEKKKKTAKMIDKYQHSGYIHDIYRKVEGS